jgi:hypothetical protein
MKIHVNKFIFVYIVIGFCTLCFFTYISIPFFYNFNDDITPTLFLLVIIIAGWYCFYLQWKRLCTVILYTDYFVIKRFFTKPVTYKYDEINWRESAEIPNNMFPINHVFIITDNKTAYTYTISKNLYRNYDAFVKYFIQMKENAALAK